MKKKKYGIGITKKKIISSKKTTTAMLSSLGTDIHVPNDVIVQILSKLSAKYLLKFRWVCKYWFKVITDPCFVKMHLIHATDQTPLVLVKNLIYRTTDLIREFCSLNPRNNAIVNINVPSQFASSRTVNSKTLGSCNGLLCIGCYRDKNNPGVFIWNPSTKQYKMIWGFESSKVKLIQMSFGFGYDRSTDDYKVIRNVRSLKSHVAETSIDVHTLGTSSTKSFRDSRFYFDVGNGVSINGDIYWKASLTWSLPCDIIVTFDFAKEEYKQITSKPFINDDKSCSSMHIGKLKGCICVVKRPANWRRPLEVWVMNHNVDNIEKEYSWDILYTFTVEWQMVVEPIMPLKFCDDEEFVMVMDDNIILYNPVSGQIKLHQRVGGVKHVETYIESLVPVKGGSYIDGPPYIDGPISIATGKRKRKVKRPLRFVPPSIDGPPSIDRGKGKREVKGPLRFQDEYRHS